MRYFMIAAVCIFGLAFSPLAAREKPAPAKTAPGARTFIAFGCAACHGTTGAGGGWQGPKLAPDPLPFDAFLAQLREPAAKMPRYSAAVLSDQQAADIHAYLTSIPRGKSAADIEMLNR